MSAYVVVCSDAENIHFVKAFKNKVDAEDYKNKEAMSTYTDIVREFGDDFNSGVEVRPGCARVFREEDVWRWSVHKIKI